MLYKRAFRKENEVTTFLIKDKILKLAWNLRIEPRSYQSEAAQCALAQERGSMPSHHWDGQDPCSRCGRYKAIPARIKPRDLPQLAIGRLTLQRFVSGVHLAVKSGLAG